MDERKEAINEALEALDLLETYDVTAAHTARVRFETTVQAANMDEAIRMAKEADYWGTEVFDYDGDDEGDETIDIYKREARFLEDNEAYIDCRRSPGQPFSWVAVQIVKDLAKVTKFNLDTFAEFIKRAESACQKEGE